MRRKGVGSTILYMLIGLACIIYGIYDFIKNDNSFRDNAKKTKGVIVKYYSRGSRHGGSSTFRPEVSYVADDGKTYKVRESEGTFGSGENTPKHHVGDSIIVFYNPNNPKDVSFGALPVKKHKQALYIIGIGAVIIVAFGYRFYRRRN